MTKPTFDLQAHSVHSDGALPAHEVVERAAAAGVELLALSDHDTVDGVDEARTAAANAGIRLVPAVEISTVEPNAEDLHLLGYEIDHRDPHLLAELERYRADRAARAWRMATGLRQAGFELDEDALRRREAEGKPIGRPHLAMAAFEHPHNARLIGDAGFTDFGQLLEAYLVPGKPAYRRREFPTVAEAIELVHAAGGVAVWAHPFWDIDADPAVLETIDRFAAQGLDGVEVFYVTHTAEQIALLDDHCRAKGLLTTGSSDFHGPEHRLFHRFRAHELHGRRPELGPIA